MIEVAESKSTALSLSELVQKMSSCIGRTVRVSVVARKGLQLEVRYSMRVSSCAGKLLSVVTSDMAFEDGENSDESHLALSFVLVDSKSSPFRTTGEDLKLEVLQEDTGEWKLIHRSKEWEALEKLGYKR